MKNKINSCIRKAKSDYYKGLFRKCKNDLRRTWSNIRALLSDCRNPNIIKSLFFNNVEHFDPDNIATIFNNYFSNVGLNMSSEIPETNIDPLSYVIRNESFLFLFPVTNSECLQILKSLKSTKSNLYSMPAVCYKLYADVFTPVIADMVNLSFQTGSFPNSLKDACITPLHKKGDRKLVSNYRPISCLPFLSKIYEKLLARRLQSFLDLHGILSPNQFGFRKGKSTESAMVNLMEYLYEALDRREYAISIFIDYKKAFDSIDHNILLLKLEAYGVRGVVLDLFRSYLYNRRHCVRIKDCFSEFSIFNVGVPQGSVLGPILFNIFINDICNISPNIKSLLYADDTTFLFSSNSYRTLLNSCNHELINFKTWVDSNKLSVNVEKTHVMLITNRNLISAAPEIYYGNTLLDVVVECTFLGVKLDRNLKFVNHIKYICSKISKSIGILYKLRNVVPNYILLNLYHSLVYPYLIYCNVIWGNSFNSILNPLFILQKRVIRIINGESFLAHTNVLFHKCNILKLGDLSNMCMSIFVYKNFDLYVQNPTHSYAIRNIHNLRSVYCRLNLTQRSISYIGPKTWNDIPEVIRNCADQREFKIKLKKHLLSKYS